MALVKCPECDSKVSTAAPSCPSCGFPIQQSTIQPPVATPLPYADVRRDIRPKGTSLAGMLCGVGGCVLMFVPCAWLIALLPSVLGIIISCIALGKIKRSEEQGRGMAITGLLCGIMGSLLYAAMWLFFQDALHEALS